MGVGRQWQRNVRHIRGKLIQNALNKYLTPKVCISGSICRDLWDLGTFPLTSILSSDYLLVTILGAWNGGTNKTSEDRVYQEHYILVKGTLNKQEKCQPVINAVLRITKRSRVVWLLSVKSPREGSINNMTWIIRVRSPLGGGMAGEKFLMLRTWVACLNKKTQYSWALCIREEWSKMTLVRSRSHRTLW